MCIIRSNCKQLKQHAPKALLLLVSMLFVVPQAQADMPWPNTFIGQADFEFLRDEVIQEIKKSEKENADKYIAVLGDLMTEETINPFAPKSHIQAIGTGKYSKSNIASNTTADEKGKERAFREVYPDIKIGEEIKVILLSEKTVNATLSSDTEAFYPEAEKMVQIAVNSNDDIVEYVKIEKEEEPNVENLFAAKGKFSGTGDDTEGGNSASRLNKYRFMDTKLPKVENMSNIERVDLTDFISFLDNILIKATSLVESNLKDKDFSRNLVDLQLQSIVTSPFKYVVINDQRYGIEDNFKFAVNVKMGKIQNIEKLIKPYIPNKDKVSNELYVEYIKLKDAAIAKYKERIGQNKENATADTHNIIVTIKSIEHRKVVLSIFGKDYPLEIKLLL